MVRGAIGSCGTCHCGKVPSRRLGESLAQEKFTLLPDLLLYDVPHSSCYTTIAADVLAQLKRLAGYEVFFLTAPMSTVFRSNARPATVASPAGMDRYRRASFGPVGAAEYLLRNFIRTSEPRHKAVAQAVFQKAYEKGDI